MDVVPGLTRQVLDRARRSRDARFDGRFFIAVKSTRIYCRPICPSRFSHDSNIRYYATAEEAAEAGYRPCLRCRPEAAPGSPAWKGTSAVIQRALRLIQDGALDQGSVKDLANRLGIGVRHLSRLFARHVGASPATVARTRRLQLAKRLLDDTRLPITDIALAAGFGSIRRFNDVFQATYRRSPSELRRSRRLDNTAHADAHISLRLDYRPPYDWEHVLRFLATVAITGVEAVSAGSYARAVATQSGHALLEIRPVGRANALQMRVRGALPAELPRLLVSVRRMFDLAADPAHVKATLQGDAMLRPLIARHPGLRIAGAWDPFECCVSTIASQQVLATTKCEPLTKLVERYGEPVEVVMPAIRHLFPTPAAIADANLETLGFSSEQCLALRRLSRAVLEGSLRFDVSGADVTRMLLQAARIGPVGGRLRGVARPRRARRDARW